MKKTPPQPAPALQGNLWTEKNLAQDASRPGLFRGRQQAGGAATALPTPAGGWETPVGRVVS